MTTRYVIHIGSEVLFLDEHKQPSGGFPAVVGQAAEPAVLRWPITDIDLTAAEWDDALCDFSAAQRQDAEVRLVVKQHNQ